MKKLLCLVALLMFATTTCMGANIHYFLQGNEPVSEIPYGNNPSAGKYVNVGDTKLYYEVYGNKKVTPFLILHGSIVGSPYEMGTIIDEVSKEGLTIVPATRGHGKSGIGNKPLTYEQNAKDMIAVLNKVTKVPVTIIGFSDGAYTAFEIARLYPNRVKAIVAIGAGENIPGVRKIPALSLDLIEKADKRFYDEKIALCPEPDKLEFFIKNYNTFINSEPISKKELSQVKCPVILIVGENDEITPLNSVLNAYYTLPDSRIAVIAGAKHTVLKISFPAVWAQISTFISYINYVTLPKNKQKNKK